MYKNSIYVVKCSLSYTVKSLRRLITSPSYCHFSVNMLKLPQYDSKDTLRKNLKTAINCCTGFGMA